MNRLLLLLLIPTNLVHAQTPFALDSATVYLRTLSVDIGPRPMGSPAEQRAIEFAIEKFREFGLHETYLMPMLRAQVQSAPVNTRTGVAVGVLRGSSDRVIVIGGHIDSAGPEIPGANDDASGSAVVIELARVLAQRQNESTLVFALFGGEEQGLLGSEYFVRNFPDIENVVLMLQVDMANGSDWILPLIDVYEHSAPTWLVRAAYEEFGRLGYRGLSYPTHFLTLNHSFPGGGIGSDHQPFLRMGIPAIDFTTDVNDPIHTPQDSFENFKPGGLKRSGDLVYRLVERFDGGVPEGKMDRYYLLQIGLIPVFVPLWVLASFIALSVILAVVALLLLRRQREDLSQATEPKARVLGFKMFLLMVVIQSCVWFSSDIIGLVKGLRFPWYANPDAYVVLGCLGGAVGIWLALQLGKKLRFSNDPYRYFLRAFVVLALFIILLSLTTVKMAFYPATALFFLALAVIVRPTWLKLLFWLAAPHFMYHLMFSEASGLIARSFALIPPSTLAYMAVQAALILVFSLWSFPFLLGFAALRFQTGRDLFWISHFRRLAGLAISGMLFLGFATVLLLQPSYTSMWRQSIEVRQEFDLDSLSGTVALRSNESLQGTRIQMVGVDTTISERTYDATVKHTSIDPSRWLQVRREVSMAAHGSDTSFDVNLHINAAWSPYSLTVSYGGRENRIGSIATPFAFSRPNGTLRMRWYSFPDTSLHIPLQFVAENADSVDENLEFTFAIPIERVLVEKREANVTFRSVLRKQTPLGR